VREPDRVPCAVTAAAPRVRRARLRCPVGAQRSPGAERNRICWQCIIEIGPRFALCMMLLAVIVTLSACSRERGHRRSAPASLSVVAPAQRRDGGGAEPTYETPVGMDQFVRSLQAALISDNRESISKSIHYPMVVGTDSGCNVKIDSAVSFIAHFDGIITPNVREVVLTAGPPFQTDPPFARSGGGTMLDGGMVWIKERDGKLGITSVVSSTWNLPGFPCLDETPDALPSWLDGSWEVTTVESSRNHEIGPAGIVGGILQVLLHTNTVHMGFPNRCAPHELTCRIDRFVTSHSEVGALRIVYLDCPLDSHHFVDMLTVVSDNLLLYGDVGSDLNSPTWRLRRLPPHPRPVRTGNGGNSCDRTDIRCAAGFICASDPLSKKGEACRPLEDYVTTKPWRQ